MRRVARHEPPALLVDNRDAWTEQLLAEIERCEASGRQVADRFFDRYGHDDIRDELKRMYRSYCCYCEARITSVSYPHIEHRKPKKKFPSETFDWTNLHLACQICNTTKGSKWKETAPILDACVDPIDQHLTYLESATGLRRWPANESSRGDTTIAHAGLNRDDIEGLPGDRVKVYMETLKAIRDIVRSDQSSPVVRACVDELRAKSREQFGSVIAFAMEEWLG